MCRAAGAGHDAQPKKDNPRINVIDTRNPDEYRRITYFRGSPGARKVKT